MLGRRCNTFFGTLGGDDTFFLWWFWYAAVAGLTDVMKQKICLHDNITVTYFLPMSKKQQQFTPTVPDYD